MRIAQISFSFSGGFWPRTFPLFHGIACHSDFVSVSVSMNNSFVGRKELHVDTADGRFTTQSGQDALAIHHDNNVALFTSHVTTVVADDLALSCVKSRASGKTRIVRHELTRISYRVESTRFVIEVRSVLAARSFPTAIAIGSDKSAS